MLNKKSILITGGTGSFGKKFTEMILSKYPEVERLVIYSRALPSERFQEFLK